MHNDASAYMYERTLMHSINIYMNVGSLYVRLCMYIFK